MKNLQKLLFLSILVMLVASCSPILQPPLAPLDAGTSKTVGKKYVPKVDNFVVLLDSSLSMDEGGKNDFLSAREIVSQINQGIPTDLNYNAGLRSIGHNNNQSESGTELVYGISSYNRSAFHEGLDKIKYVGGPTPMAETLQAVGNDLKSAPGKSAVIIVSDGLNIDDAPAAAKELKSQLGNDLCIYTISIGHENNGAGQDMMEQLASIGQCGFATSDANLSDSNNMANFIDSVFIAKAPPVVVAAAPPKDSDGDGVIDALDKCPNTPKGAPVDAVGCSLDSDGDGVFDYNDQCPDTPAGVSVDVYGCPTKLTLNINFGFDSTTVGPEFDSDLAKAAQCINDYPGNEVLIEGHTDSIGSEAYNQKLSEQRADAVKNRLMEMFDVDASRMITKGFGESMPIADNDSEGGRAMNRRVEVDCGANE